MVGRSAKLAKQSPPPSLHNSPPFDHSPPILAETTTTRTEVVTTTTTTHFFSFPLWKKRGPVSHNSSRQSTLNVHPGTDEHGFLSSSARSSFYMVEKDLPPTPPDEPAASASQRPSISLDSISRSKPLRSAFPTTTRPEYVRSVSSPSQQTSSALAQASPEVGLSPFLPPCTSESSSTNEINTVAFAPSPSSSRSLGTQSRLRKSKSVQKLGTTLSSDAVTDNEHKRSRGISFNGTNLLAIGKSDLKVGDQERKDHLDRPSTLSSFPFTSKGLSRKSSFWSRRTLQPQDSQVNPPSVEHLSAPRSTELPVLPPVSPFNMDITITSPPNPAGGEKQRGAHTRGLSRSHSAHSLGLSPSETGAPSSTHPRRPESSSSPSSASVLLSPQSVGTVGEPIVSEENGPKRRLRAQTNPPLLNRISLGWFPNSSPSLSPLPRLSNHSPVFSRLHTNPFASTTSSKGRQTTSPLSAELPSSSHSFRSLVEKGASVAVPLPTGDEEPPQYLRRLQAVVSKAEVAGILASSSNSFYSQALRTYVGEFDFVEDPLDIALRKLLMDVGLPRETQQIDRVIEAFANRYLQCNPSLFSSDDHPYILAFSLIMLHTDAFNKSNKRKMSKTDYIKNTHLPGIFPEVLMCFYDNIVFAPFIFIEDPLDFNGQHGIAHEGLSQSIVAPPILKATKIDPYYLIANNLLGPLRIDVDSIIPRETPYSYEGTAGPWDEAQLQRSFAMANQVEVSVLGDGGRVSPFFSKGGIGGFGGPSGNNGISGTVASPTSAGETRYLKLTKLGHLRRKDDVLEGGKKATNRKWKPWTVVLTGSQLLFFRDLSRVNSLLSLSSERQRIHPQSGFLRPDELLSVRGAIAVHDKSYTRHDHTFRFLLSDGRQLLLQASTEKESNEWIARINYASAFKTAGVRMRPLEMSKTDVQLTGVAAATSHLHDLQTRSIKPHIWNDDTPNDLMGMLSNDSGSVDSQPIPKRRLTIVTNSEDMDLEVPTAPEIDGAEQFKATFDQVKADLAAGLMSSKGQRLPIDTESDIFPPPAASLHDGTSHLPSRTSIIQSKVHDLDLRITTAQAQLDTKLRFARNIATLTPFQKSTRDRLLVAVEDVAQRVVQARLEITRLVCHRNVLVNDIASEWHSWNRAKTIALQAANETLQSRHEVVPRMTLSQPASEPIDTPEDSFFSHAFDSSPSRKSESSICESFYSAMDFGPDWPSSSEASTKLLGTSHLFDSPTLSASSSVHSHTTYDSNVEPSSHSSALPLSSSSQAGSLRPSGDLLSHEKLSTAPQVPEEEAEDWNHTRCAQRVSLVRLPSDIQLKTRFIRHHQQAINSKS